MRTKEKKVGKKEGRKQHQFKVLFLSEELKRDAGCSNPETVKSLNLKDSILKDADFLIYT